MTPHRYPCQACGSSIDPDLSVCPFCERPDPLAYRRTRKAGLIALSVVVLLSASAWLLIA